MQNEHAIKRTTKCKRNKKKINEDTQTYIGAICPISLIERKGRVGWTRAKASWLRGALTFPIRSGHGKI